MLWRRIRRIETRTAASDLTLICPPASGYSVPFLRDAAGLGQAVAFIRPLQADLNTDKVEETLAECEVSNVIISCAQITSLVSDLSIFCFQDSSSAPLVNCINCGIELPVTEVRGHQMNCCVDAEL